MNAATGPGRTPRRRRRFDHGVREFWRGYEAGKRATEALRDELDAAIVDMLDEQDTDT